MKLSSLPFYSQPTTTTSVLLKPICYLFFKTARLSNNIYLYIRSVPTTTGHISNNTQTSSGSKWDLYAKVQ